MSFGRVWSTIQRLVGPRASAGEERELAEIRHDILDNIRSNVQELSAGRSVFPFNYILVELRSRTPAERAAIQATWIDRGELQAEVKATLARAECEYPKDLVVETQFRESFAAGDASAYFGVTCSNVQAAARPVPAPSTSSPSPESSPGAQPLRLTVQTGSARPASLELMADTTNLGRLPEIFDENGQFIRRNDLAFEDAENGVNETVGRTHAHIVRQTDGRFALINTRRNDKSPTAILRNGHSIPVILLPEPLERGDVIQLGRARISVS
jgi:hypothetical protein